MVEWLGPLLLSRDAWNSHICIMGLCVLWVLGCMQVLPAAAVPGYFAAAAVPGYFAAAAVPGYFGS